MNDEKCLPDFLGEKISEDDLKLLEEFIEEREKQFKQKTSKSQGLRPS